MNGATLSRIYHDLQSLHYCLQDPEKSFGDSTSNILLDGDLNLSSFEYKPTEFLTCHFDGNNVTITLCDWKTAYKSSTIPLSLRRFTEALAIALDNGDDTTDVRKLVGKPMLSMLQRYSYVEPVTVTTWRLK